MRYGSLLCCILLALVACKPDKKLQEATYEFPYQNPTLSSSARAADIVSRLTTEEKVHQLFNKAPAIERLGIPRYNWWNESLHGVARAGKATVFPQAIGMAASFNEELMLEVATTISDEARAKHHNFARNDVRSIYTGLTFWSPNINIFRDPRWGRGQETYGEDPFLTGRMAVNFINGLQGDDPDYLKTIATAKHYAVHSGPEETRHSDNYFVNDRDLYQTYLPAFKMAVEEANVQSVMCAYNRFRDQPCCGSDLLLQKILREEFGFDGYVVTDCGAVSDFYQDEKHELVKRPSQAWGWALSSGTDLNCEEDKAFIEDNLEEAIEKGMLNLADINRALTRLFKARFDLGILDNTNDHPYTQIPIEKVGSEEHLAVALKSSEQSLVLLKNNGILPLKEGVKVALIGPNANNPDVLLGNYNGTPINPVTPLKALKDKLGKDLTYAPGSPLVPGFFGEMTTVPADVLFHKENDTLQPGLEANYFKDLEQQTSPDLSRVDKNIDFIWSETPISNALEETFAVTWSGILKPVTTGAYQFRMNSLYGNSKIFVNNEQVLDNYIALESGNEYDFRVSYDIKPFWWGNTVTPDAQLVWVNTSDDMVEKAINAANAADVIVFCGGISPRLEGEEMKIKTDGFAHGDRTHLKLPAIQEELLKKLKNIGKPIVYINFSGSALALNWQDEHMDAIVQAFYSGEPAGTAISRMLYGEFSPSGRLPITFYKSVDDLPPFGDYAMAGRTYRYYDGEVLYPFGHGLSYTSFEYAHLAVPKKTTTGNQISINVSVENTGEMDAREVVQLYLQDVQASTPVPNKTLIGFQNIFLKAGESGKLSFAITPEQFSLIDSNYKRVIEPGEFMVSFGSNVELQSSITLTGEVYELAD